MVDKSRKRAVKTHHKKVVKKPTTKKAAPKKVAPKKKAAVPRQKKAVRVEATLTQELREKILRRAERAWIEPSENHHRISDITKSSLTYRLPHLDGQELYSGPRLSVEKSRGKVKIYNW
jgi:hypothetical protein